MDHWRAQISPHLHHLAPGAEVVLDLSQVPLFDFEELAVLAELQGELSSRGQFMVLTGLQSQPLALLTRLGLTRQLGVRRVHRHEAALKSPRRRPRSDTARR